MGHYSNSVIFEVSKTIRSSRYHFHFVVEAFSDAVISGKPPHRNNWALPHKRGISIHRLIWTAAVCFSLV